MTRTITLYSCHILIAIWVVASFLLLLPINHYTMILNSIDENGCRISLYDNDRIICPDQPVKTNESGSYYCSECQPSGLMSNEKMIEGIRYFIISIEIFIQIIAFGLWNSHYKWIKIDVKSCWSKKEDASND